MHMQITDLLLAAAFEVSCASRRATPRAALRVSTTCWTASVSSPAAGSSACAMEQVVGQCEGRHKERDNRAW